MKTRKKINVSIFTLIAVLILSFTAKVNSQVIVKLQYPPPNQVSIEDVWKLQLITNTSQENDYHIYLLGTVANDDNGDLIWEGKSSPFYLYKGYSGPVEPSDLEPVSGNFNSKYEKLKEIAIRTGTLPAGNYTFCISVINVKTEGELGKDCIQVNVAHPSPPELISPHDEAMVEDEYPVFMWMPPMSILPGDMITYNLCIYELLDGQTAIEATEANPIWFEETKLYSTSFQFPISAREFEQGVTYAWQVTAFDENGNPVGENNGKSEVWKFISQKSVAQILLISPKDGAKVNEKYPTFTWTKPKSIPFDGEELSYAFLMKKKTNNQTVEEAMESDNNKWFLIKNAITDTSYTIPAKAPYLEPNAIYVWSIVQYSSNLQNKWPWPPCPGCWPPPSPFIIPFPQQAYFSYNYKTPIFGVSMIDSLIKIVDEKYNANYPSDMPTKLCNNIKNHLLSVNILFNTAKKNLENKNTKKAASNMNKALIEIIAIQKDLINSDWLSEIPGSSGGQFNPVLTTGDEVWDECEKYADCSRWQHYLCATGGLCGDALDILLCF